MSGKHLYEYSVIRVLPKVEREEFINIGIILFCKKERYLRVLYSINKERLSAFPNEVDIEFLEKNMQSFQKVCLGCKTSTGIASYDTPERFRWLTAVRSTNLQTSRPHTGFSDDLDATLDNLFNELVL